MDRVVIFYARLRANDPKAILAYRRLKGLALQLILAALRFLPSSVGSLRPAWRKCRRVLSPRIF